MPLCWRPQCVTATIDIEEAGLAAFGAAVTAKVGLAVSFLAVVKGGKDRVQLGTRPHNYPTGSVNITTLFCCRPNVQRLSQIWLKSLLFLLAKI